MYQKVEAAIFYDSYLPDALRLVLEYAGDNGFVASMPQLLHARANAAYDNIILSSYDIELMGDAANLARWRWVNSR